MTTAVRLVIRFAVALAVVAPAAASASGPIPRLAVSLPSSRPEPGLLPDFSRCPATACVAVAPAVDLGADLEPAGTLAGLASALPSGTGLFLHVRLPARARTASPKADEDALSAAVAQLLSTLPVASDKVRGLMLEVQSPVGDPGLLQLAVATLSVRAKAVRPALEVGVLLPPGGLLSLGEGAARLAAYVDLVGLTLSPRWREEAAWVAGNLHRPVVVAVNGTSPGTTPLNSSVLDLLLEQDSTASIDTVWVVGAPAAAAVNELIGAWSFLARSISTSFVLGEAASSPVSIEAPDGARISSRRFVTGQSSDVVVLVQAAGAPGAPREFQVAHREPGFDVTCHEVATGRRIDATSETAAGGGTTARCRSEARHVLVVLRQKVAPDRVTESVSVAGRPGLRVEEVIARWQQFREDQRRLLRHYTSKCLLGLHFEQTGLGSGFDVSVRLREFNSPAVREWIQDEFYVNGVRFTGRKGFPLPQLEPEKVVTQPLELSLDERYRYVLEGVETEDGVLCYVVRFEPTRDDETLYSGRIWIEGTGFRHVRLDLQQRGGRSNVVSHVERQDFQVLTAGERSFTVFREIAVQQVLNVAGRSLLLEKRYRFSDYEFNGEDFEAKAAGARTSDRPMFRDTAEGLRALKKAGDGRTVETVNVSRMKSLLTGVFYEGTYGFPVPMAGLSFVDFDHRRTGRQMSLFFAGPLLALNVSQQRPHHVRVGVDVALSALPQNNRRYQGDTEVTGEGVWSLEETIGGLASWQPTPNWSLSGAAHFGVNLFRATGETAANFRVPGSGGTLYLTAESKLTKRGYAVTTTVSNAERVGWSGATGVDGADRLYPRYLKYYVEVAKQFYIRSFQKAALTGSYYGGQHLDRFSRYQPSFLSRPRIRGIPGGADSFDAVGVVGASYGFNVMEFVKFEGIYNHAWGRNQTESSRFRAYDGLEFDVSTAAPWETFLQATVAYAVRGNTQRYNSRWGVYLLLFKPL